MAAAPPDMCPSRKTAVSFTGGKDSMIVLHLLRAPEVALKAALNESWREDVRERLAKLAGAEVTLLVTFVPAGGKQSFKAHPLQVIQLQARALGLPHLVMEVEATPSFLDCYRANIVRLREQYGITALATGDILDVCSSFMPRAAAGTGVELLSPLWGAERLLLLELAWTYGMEPLVTCIHATKFTAAAPAAAAGGVAGGAGAGKGADGAGREELSRGSTAAEQGEEPPTGDAAAGADAVEGRGAGGAAETQQQLACGASAPVADSAAAAAAATRGSETKHSLAREGEVVRRLLGARLDRQLYYGVLLPARDLYGVDECGEWGEYHTMVTRSALFSAPLQLSYETRREGDFAFLGILSAEMSEAAAKPVS